MSWEVRGVVLYLLDVGVQGLAGEADTSNYSGTP